MLEGSKPGAAAAGLWLTIKTIPLTTQQHGAIVRSSLLAARELYEWLTRWNEAHDESPDGLDYQFLSLTDGPPDTNLVTFVVKKKTSRSLSSMNQLTQLVYQRFTILSELGEMEYSCAQPFFLSNTTMSGGEYPYETLQPFFERCGMTGKVRKDYEEYGLAVLRATVMSPYILPMRNIVGQSVAKMFLEVLTSVAAEHVRDTRV